MSQYFFIPDKFIAQNVKMPLQKKSLPIKIITRRAACVHEGAGHKASVFSHQERCFHLRLFRIRCEPQWKVQSEMNPWQSAAPITFWCPNDNSLHHLFLSLCRRLDFPRCFPLKKTSKSGFEPLFIKDGWLVLVLKAFLLWQVGKWRLMRQTYLDKPHKGETDALSEVFSCFSFTREKARTMRTKCFGKCTSG